MSDTTLPRTGTNAVSIEMPNATVSAAAVPPGSYSVCVRLNEGAHTRYLYAPHILVVTPGLQPPAVDADSLRLSAGILHFNVHAFPGQEVTVIASNDLVNWASLETHTFSGTVWEFADANAGKFAKRFYRAVLATSENPGKK